MGLGVAVASLSYHFVGQEIGLFDAGLSRRDLHFLGKFLGFGEIFGWAHSLNTKIKEVPWFYANHFFTRVTAGLVVLIPGAPLLLCRRTSPKATGISSRTFVDTTFAFNKVL
jgi:hypothetical protein